MINGTTVLAVHQPPAIAAPASTAFEPNDIAEAYKLAKVLIASGLMPKAIKTPEAAFAIIATGRELGLTSLQSIRSIHIIEGKPVLSAQLMAALVLRSPQCERWQIVENTDKVCTIETQRKGAPKPVRFAYTFDEAKNAGLTGKDNWRKYAADMLVARCTARACRGAFPDLFFGIYENDEADDIRGTRQPQSVPDVTVATEQAHAEADATTTAIDEPAPVEPAADRVGRLLALYAEATEMAHVDAVREMAVNAHNGSPFTKDERSTLGKARADAEARVNLVVDA